MHKENERYNLDNNGLIFLSVYYDEKGMIRSYSIDIEKANDSHYQFNCNEMMKLFEYLQKELDTPSIVGGLKRFVESNGELQIVELLEKLGIQYQPFHYDDYSYLGE